MLLWVNSHTQEVVGWLEIIRDAKASEATMYGVSAMCWMWQNCSSESSFHLWRNINSTLQVRNTRLRKGGSTISRPVIQLVSDLSPTPGLSDPDLVSSPCLVPLTTSEPQPWGRGASDASLGWYYSVAWTLLYLVLRRTFSVSNAQVLFSDRIGGLDSALSSSESGLFWGSSVWGGRTTFSQSLQNSWDSALENLFQSSVSGVWRSGLTIRKSGLWPCWAIQQLRPSMSP
jgi:hypothetical protein